MGPQGNVPIPAKDDAITVYSTQPKERQRTETSPDSRADAIVYVPLLPNGLVINKQNRGTPGPATTTPPQPNSDDAIDNQTRINLQRFSNASSYQFMATFALFKEMLENEWDEKLFRQFEFYERLNQQAVSSYQEQYQDDKTWGPWFRKKGTFQQENFKKLVPYIQKRRKGEALSPDDMGSLLQLQRQITAQLGK